MGADVTPMVGVALLVAGASWLMVVPAAERRLVHRTQPGLPRWLTPVPDALGIRPRGLAAGASGVAVALWSSGWSWGGLVVAAAVTLGVFLALGRVTSAGSARRQAELRSALPAVCELLAVAVAAGLPLRSAVDVAVEAVDGPARQVLAEVAARVRLGEPESQAWAELEREPALQTIAHEVSRTVSSGLGLAPLLRELAVEERRAGAAAAVVRARQVGVRSVMPLMLAFLPSFILLGIVPIVGGIISTVLP